VIFSSRNKIISSYNYPEGTTSVDAGLKSDNFDSIIKKKREKGFIEITAPIKRRLNYSSKKVKKIGAAVIGMTTRDLGQRVRKLVGRSIIITLLMIGICDLLVWFFYKKSVINPLAEITSSAVKVSKGDFESTVKVNSDDEIGFLAETFNKMISNLKTVQEKLIDSGKLVAIGKLASGVGHELRTPLASIKNAVFYLENYAELKDQETKEYLNTLSKEVRTAEGIISDLLNFSQKREFNIIKTSLNQIIEEALEEQKIRNNIKVSVELDKDTEEIWVDHDKIKKALKNIIINSIQAMPNGGNLDIRSFSENGMVNIKIKDNGIGMSEDTIDYVFEPLFTTKAKGIGLGTVIAKDIIQKHEGDIKVESKEGAGTEFIISIPKRANG
ncbi:MAG: ATP-binding protein, partial [Elusimicrobiota bacterium]